MVKPVEKGCRNCVHLEVPPDKIGRRVVRADTRYKCNYQIPDMPAVPQWMEPGLKKLINDGNSHWSRNCWSDDGKKCNTYEEVKK